MTQAGAERRRYRYDAFLSYSINPDAAVAGRLHSGLEQLAKPWNRRRALRVFRDAEELAPGADLPGRLRQRIAESKAFVLLASTRAAQSEWVLQEVAEWARTRGDGPQPIIVLTDGAIEWDDAAGDFDWERSTAMPRTMAGVFASEPLYLDYRWMREPAHADTLHLRGSARFRAALASLAAPLHPPRPDEHGALRPVAPADLESADTREFRKAQRFRRVVLTAISALTVAAVVFAVYALVQQSIAEREARRALSRGFAGDAVARIGAEFDLAALLALESLRIDSTLDAEAALLAVLGAPTHFLGRVDLGDEPVGLLAYAPDETVVAAADFSGAVWLLDPATRALRLDGPLAHPAFGVRPAIAFTDDGARLRTVTLPDGTVRTWDVATGALLSEAGTTDGATAAALDSGASTLALLVGDTVEVWELGTDGVPAFAEASPAAGAPGDTTGTALIAISGDARTVAWTGGDGGVVAWDRDAAAAFAAPVDAPAGATPIALAVSHDGALLAVSFGEALRVASLRPDAGGEAPGLAPDAELERTPSEAMSLAFTRDGQRLVSHHADGSVRIWDTEDAALGFLFESDLLLGHKEEGRAVVASPSGTQIASASFDGEVVWWRVGAERAADAGVPPLEGHRGAVLGVAFLGEEGATLASVAGDGLLRLWPVTGGAPAERTLGDDARSVARVPRVPGDLVAVGLASGGVVVLDAAADVPVATLAHSCATCAVIALAADEEGRFIVSATEDGEVRLWDGFALAASWTHAEVEAVAISAASGLVASGGSGAPDDAPEDAPGTIEVRRLDEAATAEPLVIGGAGEGHDEAVTALAFSADGGRLASGGTDRRILAWDARSGRMTLREALAGHRADITGLAFARNDRALVSASRDGRVLIWNVRDERLIGTLGDLGNDALALALSPDGLTVAAGGEPPPFGDGESAVSRWTIDVGTWRDVACVAAGRNMTLDEWIRFAGPDEAYAWHCAGFAPGAGVDEAAAEPAEYALGDDG